MIVAYNPFEILNLPMIRQLVRQRIQFIVLQRFSWPGLREGSGFIATPYKDELSAKRHVARLTKNEGKALSLSFDIEKITRLINTPKYHLFLGSFREGNWEQKVLLLYQQKISAFLKSGIPAYSGDGINIQLYLTYGHLKAIAMMNGSEYEFNVSEMIK